MTSFVFPEARFASGYSVRTDKNVIYARDTPLLVFGSGEKTVLFAHGNSSAIGDHVPIAVDMAATFGCRVVLYEYPGYGGAAGRPSPAGLNAAALNAYRFARREFDGQVYGMSHSLGCGPTSSLGRVEESGGIDGIALFAPFCSTRQIGRDWAGMLTDAIDWPDWDVAGNVASVASKVLFVHGELDELIPFRHSSRLFAAAKAPWRRLSIDPIGTHLYLTTNWLDEFLGVSKPVSFRYGIGQQLNFVI